jgi:dTMP kinase
MSLFITFEGGEGCGKSTQSRLLYRRLLRLAVPAVLTHEPGVTPLGKRITLLLKWSDSLEISPVAELMLFNASRAQLVREVIKPNLEKGMTVICDRYADSTTAYQGYGRQMDVEMVMAANSIGTGGIRPDLTFLLDMPGGEGLCRKEKQRPDRFHSEDGGFHKRVREGYLKMAASEPRRWVVVDAARDRGEIAGVIWQRVSRMLSVKD